MTTKNSRSLLTLQEAAELVARNDGDGDDERLQLDHVSSLVCVCLAAIIFGVTPEQFARRVIKYRKQEENADKKKQAASTAVTNALSRLMQGAK